MQEVRSRKEFTITIEKENDNEGAHTMDEKYSLVTSFADTEAQSDHHNNGDDQAMHLQVDDTSGVWHYACCVPCLNKKVLLSSRFFFFFSVELKKEIPVLCSLRGW